MVIKRVVSYVFRVVESWNNEILIQETKRQYSFQKSVGFSTHGFFRGNITIGEGTYINDYYRIISGTTSKVVIGSNCAIGRFVSIAAITHSKIRPTKSERYSEHLKVEKDIYIGNGVWIGDNVSILPGIQIGDNAILGANAVITKNVSRFQVVGGVPAKVLGINTEHHQYQ